MQQIVDRLETLLNRSIKDIVWVVKNSLFTITTRNLILDKLERLALAEFTVNVQDEMLVSLREE